MPSQQNQPKKKAEYSLFRLDVVCDDTDAVDLVVRLDSEGFSDLDPKDSLYRRLHPLNSACMPETMLIPWNARTEDMHTLKFTSPALLKASMGSGGFGLYYVYHPRDIAAVMTKHRRRAETEPRFMDNLIASYEGEDPCWSLQEIVDPMRVFSDEDGQVNRTQVRAYVILCNNELYLYDGIEVRIPSWDINIDQVLLDESTSYSGADVEQAIHPHRPWSDPVEEECCGDGNARPYNEQRNKKRTNRLMLEEIESMEGGRESIRACVISAFSALKESILTRHIAKSKGDLNDDKYMSMAIVGVDLLLSHHPNSSFRAVIVEVNNNPAMPSESKQMSVLYRAHLQDMVSAFMLKALCTVIVPLAQIERVAALVAKFKQI